MKVGEVCNRELGSPYARCLRLFHEAKDKCERTIPFLSFLCYIVVIFRPLCGLAKGVGPCPSVAAGGWVGGWRGGPLPVAGVPALAEIPSLRSCPPLLRHPQLHPVLPQEENFRS